MLIFLKLTLILFFVSFITLRAQGPEIINDHALTYQKIMFCEGKSREVLLQHIKAAIYNIYDSTYIELDENQKIIINSGFRIYNILIGKIGNPAGKLIFRLTIEVKNNKYRYCADKFYFTPLERNRYGRFNQINRQPVLVSNENYSGNKPLLNKIKKQSRSYLEKLEKALQDYIALSQNKKAEW